MKNKLWLCRNKKLDAKLVEAMIGRVEGFGNCFLIVAETREEAKERYQYLMHSRIISNIEDVEATLIDAVDHFRVEVIDG